MTATVWAGDILSPSSSIALLPFNPFRTNLYTWKDLLGNGTDQNWHYSNSIDAVCYNFAMEKDGHRRADLGESNGLLLLHDGSIEKALDEYVSKKKVVGIMGDHSLPRQEKSYDCNGRLVDAPYMRIALMAQELSQAGYLVETGGGPGAMEAGNLGAFFANGTETDLREAVRKLELVPVSSRTNVEVWLKSAFGVIHNYTNAPGESLGVPTWYYGSEPSNPFATEIAKHFDNSLREDKLLSIANSGIVFTKGQAGTVQEIFQSACKDYYNANDNKFRMILFDAGCKNYWDAPDSFLAWPLLQQLGNKGNFANSIILTGDIDAVVKFLRQ